MLEVVDAGLHATIQDGGRTGYAHLGVAYAGAADRLALAVANALLEGDPDAPALEMTLTGGTFRVLVDTTLAIAGADMGALVLEEGRPLGPAARHRVASGTTLAFGAARDGARTVLALPGGIDAERVLGSASTDPVGGFGGLGRGPVVHGDVLRPLRAVGAAASAREWPPTVPSSGVATLPGPHEIALLPGPHLDRLPASTADVLASTIWTVSAHSDRVGLRLEGPPIGGERPPLASLPMLPGAVQLPSGGQPIVLMPDAPTVGGYPVVAVVVGVDRPRLGQLRPGDEVRFRWVDAAAAAAWRRDADDRFAAVVARWA